VVQAQLCVDREVGKEVLAAATRRWLEVGVDQLGGDLWRQMLDRAVPMDELDQRWQGQPGDVWAELAFEYFTGPREYFPYSEQGWRELLGHVDKQAWVVAVTAYELAEVAADRLHPGFPRLSLTARYVDLRSLSCWGLKAQASVDLVLGGIKRERNLLSMVREVADMCAPSYGEISYDNASHIDCSTSWEHNLGRRPWLTVRAAATTLRGYSWLTIIGQQIGDRLGGVARLRASGAFVEVDQLANGGYWLLATERFADYGPDAAARVQWVLAPALPAGLPRPDLAGELPHLLAPVDAHPNADPEPDDDYEPFKNRVDPRDTSAHATAIDLRMLTLAARYPHALIWGANDGEDGPHLVCWNAEPAQVWTWQFMPEDDPYAGMDTALAPGTDLATVQADALSAGMQVRLGPTFGELGLPTNQAAAGVRYRCDLVTVFDGRAGLQLYYTDEDATDIDSRDLTEQTIRVALDLKDAVHAARADRHAGVSPSDGGPTTTSSPPLP
jgi:hypothetical protein